MAESFQEDPLYQYMLPNKETRKKTMEIFFEVYLDIFAPYGELVVDSKKVGGVGYIYYENRFKCSIKYKINLLKGFIKSLKMLKYVSVKDLKRILNTVQNTSSDWIHTYVEGDYIHIDLIGIKENYRGKGIGTHIIQYALSEAKKYNLPVTLETQNENNLSLYKRLGFEVVESFRYKGLTQYCMVYYIK